MTGVGVLVDGGWWGRVDGWTLASVCSICVQAAVPRFETVSTAGPWAEIRAKPPSNLHPFFSIPTPALKILLIYGTPQFGFDFPDFARLSLGRIFVSF